MYRSQVCDYPCFIEPNSHLSCKGSPRPRLVHNRLFRYSQQQSACLSRLVKRRKSTSGAYFPADRIDSAYLQTLLAVSTSSNATSCSFVLLLTPSPTKCTSLASREASLHTDQRDSLPINPKYK